MATRKMFNRLAEEIAAVHRGAESLPDPQSREAQFWIDKTLVAVGTVLKEQNPNFDWDKFLTTTHKLVLIHISEPTRPY